MLRRVASLPAIRFPRCVGRSSRATVWLAFSLTFCLGAALTVPAGAQSPGVQPAPAAVEPAPAAAQSPAMLPAALERPGAVKIEQRVELQHELDRCARAFEAQSALVRTVAKLIGPTVVHIEADVTAENSLQYGRGRQVEEAGSGVIIERKGAFYVLTNRHVIRSAEPRSIKIGLADGRRIYPTKVFEDAASDVAVLAVSEHDLVAATIGDSNRIEIGDFVLAVGSPFGLSHSVTYGIISAKGRRDLHLSEKLPFQDFLQTDAAINPGNSGGPLVDLRGEVIGINTAIASNSGGNEGIGFSIPINMFMVFARQLIETGKVTRAFLGVNLDGRYDPAVAAELGLPRPIGALISGTTPKSPAEVAKLQKGDVILEFNSLPVEDDAHLMNLVSLTEVGKRVPLLIFRNRKPITVTVEVSERSKYLQ
jgi:serine protease Do